jgi:Flp pilus assembly pilin Flp
MAMKNAKELLVRLVKEESGVAMIEYALLASLISLAAVESITQVGQGVNRTFGTILTALTK